MYVFPLVNLLLCGDPCDFYRKPEPQFKCLSGWVSSLRGSGWEGGQLRRKPTRAELGLVPGATDMEAR